MPKVCPAGRPGAEDLALHRASGASAGAGVEATDSAPEGLATSTPLLPTLK